MDQATVVTIFVALIVGGLGYLGVRFTAKHGASGGVKESAAESLWKVMTTRVEAAEAKVQRYENDRIRTDDKIDTLRSEVLTLRTEQASARNEMIDEKRANRAVVDGLEAQIRDLKDQLAKALAALNARIDEVAELKRELGKPEV
jgi:predicted RNase H-like nuclease (RuvC/YqgF family)